MSEFLIMFREVLEGVLVVGILYTFIVKTGREHLKKSIINGVIASDKYVNVSKSIKFMIYSFCSLVVLLIFEFLVM